MWLNLFGHMIAGILVEFMQVFQSRTFFCNHAEFLKNFQIRKADVSYVYLLTTDIKVPSVASAYESFFLII